ncbi:endonuclease/exonuclease/phosphatase family protein [Candidatus Venteria ishoeyi]|uniref:Endonuclease/exonuclease/phosphatase domain-containing protein n=1 Tax=Candidatus Venteria ishoeyi TaxID=1899563 RepID=A0A1H6FGE0_9GAMM|nr:endonuclease/exonuclease/phosphatase family protein [Candidatus Venteria ishoeyi]SEH09140.1 Uncharacterised protein [Candidatus Venteria ishoeyi]SEH09269.1 Uncharacterised protein [Candidatus Venteria ishoeyi]
MRRYISIVFKGLTLLVLTATTLSLLEHQLWFCALFSHFRPFYALWLGLALLLLIWQPRKPHVYVALLALLSGLALNLYYVLPQSLFPGIASAAHTSLTPALRITHINLDRHVQDYGPVLAYLRAREDDILLLQEVTPRLLAQLPSALPAYDIIIHKALENSHGSAILRHRQRPITVLAKQEWHLPASSLRPLLSVQLSYAGQNIQVLSLHTTRPRLAFNFEDKAWFTGFYQNEELAAVAAWSREQQAQGLSTLILGDFNTTPWAGNFQYFLQQGQLQDAARPWGWHATWPSPLPVLPIDLCSHSADLRVNSYQIGPHNSGDHRALHIQL